MAAISLVALSCLQRSYADDHSAVQEIYGKLVRASGDPRRPPRLQIRPARERQAADAPRVAWFDPDEGVIGIDETTVALCMQFGGRRSEDCLALFLGHELAHFYKDHRWGSDFGSHFSPLSVAGRIRRQQSSPAQLLTMETQADEAGELYGYMAGYDTLGIAPDALKKVYRAYGLGNSLRGYPSLRERREIARRSAEDLQELLPVFDAGNVLLLLGHFADAARCFESIAATFPSREILNNEGVARALAGAQLLSQRSYADDYPWTLEGETRLSLTRVLTREASVGAESLLRDAQDVLEQATRRDPAYIPAWINLADVSNLLGQHGTAADQADEAIRLAKRDGERTLKGSALLVKAIAIAHAGQTEAAIRMLSVRGAEIGPQADVWTGHIANPAVASSKTYTDRKASMPQPGIDGARPDQIRFYGPPIKLASDPNEPRLLIRSQPVGKDRALLIVLENKRIYAIFTARNSSAGTSHGLHEGSLWTDVQQACGNDGRMYGVSAGRWMDCSPESLILQLDGEGAVTRLASYVEKP